MGNLLEFSISQLPHQQNMKIITSYYSQQLLNENISNIVWIKILRDILDYKHYAFCDSCFRVPQAIYVPRDLF